MMSRKDYVAIAAQLRFSRGSKHRVVRDQVLVIAYALSHYMERDNPRFNRSKFLAACGVGS